MGRVLVRFKDIKQAITGPTIGSNTANNWLAIETASCKRLLAFPVGKDFKTYLKLLGIYVQDSNLHHRTH